MTDFFTDSPHRTAVIVILGIWAVYEISSRFIKSAIKRRIYGQYAEVRGAEAGEFYLEYYRRSQIIDIFRILGFLAMINALIIYAVPGAFSFLAIAAGAMILTFKEVIISFIAFFYVVAHFKVGDTIGVSGARGEIIYIRFLNVGIVGRDENTEHTGTLHVIPNSRFILDSVQKEELSSTSYRCEKIEIPFDPSDFNIAFDAFLQNLEDFLSKNLKVRTVKQVGNFRSFAGTQYKMDFSYSNRGKLIVTVRFIAKAGHLSDMAKKIIIHVESMRSKQKEANAE